MGFSEAIRTCFRKYIVFSGRARRPEYWWFILFILLGNFVFSLLDTAVFGASPPVAGSGTVEPRAQIFSSLFQLATFLPLLAVGWRRLHDSGRPGWYLILPLGLTLVGILALSGGVFGMVMLGRGVEDLSDLVLPIAAFGVAGLVLLALLQLFFLVLLIWWLTRPTQPGPNRYGPEPPADPSSPRQMP